MAGASFGTLFIFLKISELQPTQFLFPMAIGIFALGWILFFIKRSKPDMKIIKHAMVSGVFWNIANFASMFAILYLGLTVGFPLTQTALLVGILWGLFYFKEFKKKQKIIQVIIGAIIIIIGAFLLGFSK